MVQRQSHAGRLAAFFPEQDIAYVQATFTARRTCWFERDRHFHLRRQDGTVHLQRPSDTPTQVKPSSNTRRQVTLLRLLTYNCQSFGKGSTRLQEFCEDMHELRVTVAALQGTRWRSGDPRSEWGLLGADNGDLLITASHGADLLRIRCWVCSFLSAPTCCNVLLCILALIRQEACMDDSGGCGLSVVKTPMKWMSFLWRRMLRKHETMTRGKFSFKLCLKSCMQCPSAHVFGCSVTSTGMLVRTFEVVPSGLSAKMSLTTTAPPLCMHVSLQDFCWQTALAAGLQRVRVLMGRAPTALTLLR